jgi:hypothetical protein
MSCRPWRVRFLSSLVSGTGSAAPVTSVVRGVHNSTGVEQLMPDGHRMGFTRNICICTREIADSSGPLAKKERKKGTDVKDMIAFCLSGSFAIAT